MIQNAKEHHAQCFKHHAISRLCTGERTNQTLIVTNHLSQSCSWTSRGKTFCLCVRQALFWNHLSPCLFFLSTGTSSRNACGTFICNVHRNLRNLYLQLPLGTFGTSTRGQVQLSSTRTHHDSSTSAVNWDPNSGFVRRRRLNVDPFTLSHTNSNSRPIHGCTPRTGEKTWLLYDPKA